MEQRIYDTCTALLRRELAVATGCTEPIAIAYAGARLRQILGAMPERCTVRCSGNVVKNVRAVTVPNAGGGRGIALAAALGLAGGRWELGLDVLQSVSEAERALARRFCAEGRCRCELAEGVENLYIRLEGQAGEESAAVEIRGSHDRIARIEKNGETVFDADDAGGEGAGEPDRSLLTLRAILEFADCAALEDIREPLERQLELNSAIAEEGLRNPWGAEVGRSILERLDGRDDVAERAKAYAAAASDARMNGCAMPVVINSGSGNQGIAASMPLLVYARALGVGREKLLRALAVSNLTALHQKSGIGNLSAYCGAVCAAAGSACGVAYLLGADYEQIAGTLVNAVNTVGGMVCDGAKSSCAAKIAAAVGAALLGMQMSLRGRRFRPGEGLVREDVEDTIAAVSRMGREGMRGTDVEILKLMLEEG